MRRILIAMGILFAGLVACGGDDDGAAFEPEFARLCQELRPQGAPEVSAACSWPVVR